MEKYQRLLLRTCIWFLLLPLALLIVSLFLTLPLQAHNETTYRVAYYDNKPNCFKDEKGEAQGFYIDLMREIAKSEGWQLAFVHGEWADQLAKLEAAEVDVLMVISYSKERDKIFDYPRQMFTSSRGIVYGRPGVQVQSILDLEGKRVVVNEGDIHAKDFVNQTQKFNVEVEIINTPSYDAAAKHVENGQADFVVVDSFWGDANEDQYRIIKTQVAFTPVSTTVAVPEGRNKALLQTVDDYLERWKQDKDSPYHFYFRKWLRSGGVSPDFLYTEDASLVELTAEERTWLDENPVIILSTTSSWPPGIMYDKATKSYVGFHVDYMKLLEEQIGVEFKTIYTRWDEAVQMAKDHKVDALFPAAISEDRKPYLNFTNMYAHAPLALASYPNIPKVTDWRELAGKRVSINAGSTYIELISQLSPEAKIVITDTPLEAINAVITYKADFTFNQLDVLIHLMRKNSLSSVLKINQIQYSDNHGQSRLAVRNNAPELLSILNKAIASLKIEQVNFLKKKWMDISPENVPKVELTQKERAWLAKHPDITLSFPDQYEPYLISNQDGSKTGILVDILAELNQRLGTEIKLKTGLLPKILAQIKKGELDGILALHPEYSAKLGFLHTQGYINAYPTLFGQRGITLNTPTDLAGKKITHRAGEYFSQKIIDQYGKGAQIFKVDNILGGLRMVDRGEADVFVGVSANTYLISKYQLSNILPKFVFLDYPDEFCITVRSDWPQLVSILNKGLESFSDNEMHAIITKWIQLPGQLSGVEMSAEEKAWLKEHPDIRMGGGIFPPLDGQNTDGEVVGIARDYADHIARKLGIRFEHSSGVWTDVHEQAKRREIDGIRLLVPNKERDRYLNFTRPYTKLSYGLVMRDSVDPVSNLTELGDKRVATLKASYDQDYLSERYPEIILVPYKSYEEGIGAILNGKADAFFGALAPIVHIIRSQTIPGLRADWMVHGFPSRDLTIGIREDWPELIPILDKAISSITAEEHAVISKKWMAGLSEALPKIELTIEERAWLAGHPVIRVHNEMNWPPYNYNENGRPQGHSIDFMNLVAKKAGLQVEYISGHSWDEFLNMTRNKELDVMLNIAQNKEREQYLEFTSPYVTLSQRIAYKSGDGPYHHISELKEKKIAIVEGFFTVSFLKETHPDIELVSFPDALEALLAVARGKADAFVGEFAVLNYLMNKHSITNLTLSTPLDRKEFQTSVLRIAVRKDWKILAQILDKTIAEISLQERTELKQKWFFAQKESLPLEKAGRGPWWMLIGAITIFLVMLIGALLLPRIFSDESLTRLFGSVQIRIIALAGMSLMAVIVGLLVWYTLDQNKKTTLASLSAELKIVLQNTMERNDFWIHERLSLLNQLGRDPELVAITKRLLKVPPEPDALKKSRPLTEAREFVSKREKEFGKIGFFIINPENVSIGSRRDSNLGTKNLIAIQKPDLLAQVFRGKPVFIPPIRSDVHIQVYGSKKESPAEKPLTMFFAAPIRDLDGGVIAVLTQRLVPAGQMSKNMHSGRIGRSRESYMIDLEGRQVTESRFRAQLINLGLLDLEGGQWISTIEVRDPGVNLFEGHQSTTPRSRQPFTRMAEDLFRLARKMKETNSLADHSEIMLDVNGYRDYRGVPVFGAWMWESHLGLGIATEIDVDEALSGYYTLRQNLLIITGAMLLLSIIATLLTIILGERATRVMRHTQKELEGLVSERTERLRSIIDTAVDGIIVMSQQGVIRDFSPAAEAIFGYSAGEVKGHSVNVLLPETEKERQDGSLERYLETDVKKILDHSLEVTGRRKDGQLFPMELSVAEGNIGRERFFTGIVRDITKRKQAEEGLRKLTRAVEDNPMAVIITDRQGTIEYVNPKFTDITGYESDEAIGQNPRILKSDQHSQEFFKELWETILAGKEWHGELFNKRKTGEFQWQSAIITPIIDENEKITHFVSIQEDITEKKQAAEQLQKLSRAIEASPVSVVVTDTQGTIEYVNPNFCEVTGYSQEEAIGQNPRILNSNKQSPEFYKDMWATLTSGSTWKGELANKKKNGELFWEQTSISPIINKTGAITHYVAMKEDITERRLMEIALRKSEEQMSQAAQIGNLGYWELELQTLTFIVSNLMWGLLGTSAEEEGGDTIEAGLYLERFCHPEDRAIIERHIQIALSAKESFEDELEFRVIRTDGAIRNGYVRYRVSLDEAGVPERARGFQHDITERKKVEQELILSKKRMEILIRVSEYEITDTKEFLDNALAEALELTSSNFGFIYFYDEESQEFELNTWSTEVLPVCHVMEPKTIYSLEATGLWGEVVRQRRSIIVNDYSPEHPLSRGTPEGHVELKRFMSVPIFEGGRIVAVVGVANRPEEYENIDAQQLGLLIDSVWKMLESYKYKSALVIARDEAEAATNAKSDFLANMSHEIRTPMNAVLGFLELVLEDPSLLENQRKHLTTAQVSANSLLGVINDILDISKLESGKLTIEQRPFSLFQLMKEIHDTVDMRAQEKGVELQLDIQPSLSGSFLGDPLRLRQILINLVGNAIKFTENGSVSIRIMPAEEEGQLHFMIEDTGIGIPADRISQIFESFIQADTSTTRQYGGTGLGTTISRELVELMGGRIWAESEEGKGSTFHFTINMPPTDQVPEEADLFIVPGRAVLPSSRCCFKILLVEDVQANVDLAKIRLEQQGHEITVAWNGREAVEAFQRGGINLILMDIQMPEMSGLEATERIRALEADTGRHVPIIAMTAGVMREETEKYLEAGMDAVVAKPIAFGKLFKTMEAVVPQGVGEVVMEVQEDVRPPSELELPTLDGVDIKKGIQTWQNPEAYAKALLEFSRDYGNAAADLTRLIDEGDIDSAYHIAHALRGVAGNLSITGVADAAVNIDTALRENRIDDVKDHLSILAAALNKAVDSIRQLETVQDVEEMPKKEMDVPYLKALFIKMLAAFDEFNPNVIEPFLSELKEYLSQDQLSPIVKHMERFDFDGAKQETVTLAKSLKIDMEG
ncbi:transporter substrate-binding domain-containing protein [Thermodesulfobacteriota bacterium]